MLAALCCKACVIHKTNLIKLLFHYLAHHWRRFVRKPAAKWLNGITPHESKHQWWLILITNRVCPFSITWLYTNPFCCVFAYLSFLCSSMPFFAEPRFYFFTLASASSLPLLLSSCLLLLLASSILILFFVSLIFWGLVIVRYSLLHLSTKPVYFNNF